MNEADQRLDATSVVAGSQSGISIVLVNYGTYAGVRILSKFADLAEEIRRGQT